MGLSSSKTTSGPSKAAMPYLKSASSAIQGAFDANQGNIANITDKLGATFDGYNTSNPTLTAANGYVQDVLGGKYLNGNPALQGVIDDTNASVSDRVNALFSRSGQTGSSRQIGELGKQLSSAENNLRYQNYSDEQARIAAAIAQAQGLNSAQNENYATQANLGQSLATIPLTNASFLADSLGGLWGNSTTTKTSGNLGQSLMGIGGAALGGWASGGFK